MTLGTTHDFDCPLCGQKTSHTTPLDHILLAWIRCTKCGREFLVEDGSPKHPETPTQ